MTAKDLIARIEHHAEHASGSADALVETVDLGMRMNRPPETIASMASTAAALSQSHAAAAQALAALLQARHGVVVEVKR